MTTTDAFAPAKVNLTLHVTGQRPDGYHLLHSLVAFADIGDRLSLTRGQDIKGTVSGPFASGVPTDSRNLVWRAAQAAGWTGHIALAKHLPHGAGIGGGSSDAAAVLRALGFRGDATPLGADVPVCLMGRAAMMSGIGEVVTPVTGLPPLNAVLVNPGAHVPTPAVFAALTDKANPPMPPLPGNAPEHVWMGWLAAQRNDLERPAREISPVIGDTLRALADCPQAGLVRMSGSGATCFGLFPDAAAARAAASTLSARHPDWWCVATVLS